MKIKVSCRKGHTQFFSIEGETVVWPVLAAELLDGTYAGFPFPEQGGKLLVGHCRICGETLKAIVEGNLADVV